MNRERQGSTNKGRKKPKRNKETKTENAKKERQSSSFSCKIVRPQRGREMRQAWGLIRQRTVLSLRDKSIHYSDHPQYCH